MVSFKPTKWERDWQKQFVRWQVNHNRKIIMKIILTSLSKVKNTSMKIVLKANKGFWTESPLLRGRYLVESTKVHSLLKQCYTIFIWHNLMVFSAGFQANLSWNPLQVPSNCVSWRSYETWIQKWMDFSLYIVISGH